MCKCCSDPVAAHIKSNTRRSAFSAVWSLYTITFCFSLAMLILPITADKYGWESYSHDQLGQEHFASPAYTKFESKAVYTTDRNYSMLWQEPVYKFAYFFFDQLVPLLPGYVVVKDTDTLALGPNVEYNEWHYLLGQYWVVLLWVLFLLTLIIVIPFIAVCYCCIWYRLCKKGCPSCDEKKDFRRHLCLSILLVLVILGILLGLTIVFANYKLLDRGFGHTSHTLKRGTKDTCIYLSDVSDHISHLFENNFEELSNHLRQIVNEAVNHVYFDLMKDSECDSVHELERMFKNMVHAKRLMGELQVLKNKLRFHGSQLRDGLRGVKRDLIYALATMCGSRECVQFIKKSGIDIIDTSPCLHFDQIPDIDIYINYIDGIMASKDNEEVEEAAEQLRNIKKRISAGIDPIIPPIINDINVGQELFRGESTSLRSIVTSVITEIHAKTLASTKSFEDLDDKIGSGRSFINASICLVILLILIVLIVAFIFGWVGRGNSDNILSRNTGATCMLFAIVLIFSVFSFIVLVGLFYFIFGLVTYQGACAPVIDKEIRSVFNHLDSGIDLNKHVPILLRQSKLPPLRMSTAIGACLANQTIFNLLQETKLYDIETRLRIKIMSSPTPNVTFFPANLVDFFLHLKLKDILGMNFTSYHSEEFKIFMCNKLTPVDVSHLLKDMKALRSSLWTQWGIYDWVRNSLHNEALNLKRIHEQFHDKVISILDDMRRVLDEVDKFILYKNFKFGKSVEILMKAAGRATHFMKDNGEKYASDLRLNLTIYIDDQMNNYIQMVITECLRTAGHCAPLAYIYYRGMELICKLLIDPLNGIWVGLHLCGLLFLPLLVLAHYLHCLYRKMARYEVQGVGIIETNCAFCTAYASPYRSGFVADAPNYCAARQELNAIDNKSCVDPIVPESKLNPGSEAASKTQAHSSSFPKSKRE